MKIAYIVTGDPYDKNSWSGTNYYVRTALEQRGAEIYCIYGMPIQKSLSYFNNKICARIQRKSFDPCRSLQHSRRWADYISSKIQPGTDCILSLSTIPVSFLDIEIPVFLYIDGVFEQIRTYYPSNFRNKDIEIGNVIERQALEKSKKIFTAADFTKDAISSLYSIPNNKIRTIPLGANLEEYPCLEEVKSWVERRRLDRAVKLLFVGVDWFRKGADLVIKTSEKLRDSGVEVRVDLVGIRDVPVELPKYVHNYGFLDKNVVSDFSLLTTLYKDSSFLVVPSRAEAYGLVFCEANSYGLPVFSLMEGGLLTIVEQGVNGYLFKEEDFVQNTYNMICRFRKRINEYHQLCLTSHQRFASLLNWRTAGGTLLKSIEESL